MTVAAITPEARAFQLRKDLGIKDRTFDLVGLIENMDIRVEYSDLQQEAQEGFSFRVEHHELIVIDPRKRTLPGQRFTLAHELGHILLGHADTSGEWGTSEGAPGSNEEDEANRFASALLMPKQLFLKDMKGKPTTFEGIELLATLYDVSLTAAAIRFVTLTDDYCALVGIQRRPENSWPVKSRAVNDWWLRLPPSNETLASSVAESGTVGSGPTLATAWIPKYNKDPAWEVHEEIRNTSANSCIILLTNLPDPEDDTGWEEEAADQEREQRRQRFSQF